jgi:hypothetical protein
MLTLPREFNSATVPSENRKFYVRKTMNKVETMKSQLFSDLTENFTQPKEYNTKGYHRSPVTYEKSYKNAKDYDNSYHFS